MPSCKCIVEGFGGASLAVKRSAFDRQCPSSLPLRFLNGSAALILALVEAKQRSAR